MKLPVLETYFGTLLVKPKCPGVAPFAQAGKWELIEDPERPGQFYWRNSTNSYGTDICEKIDILEDANAC